MRVWWCKFLSVGDVELKPRCLPALAADFPDEDHAACGWMDLHPAGSRVVSGEALVGIRQVIRSWGFDQASADAFATELLDALADKEAR